MLSESKGVVDGWIRWTEKLVYEGVDEWTDEWMGVDELTDVYLNGLIVRFVHE